MSDVLTTAPGGSALDAIRIAPAPLPPKPSRWRWASWALIATAFIVYLLSFSSYSILEERYDVLGDGDSAAFAVVLRDFSPFRIYGDPYRVEGRSVADVAQKHKVHHFPYAAIGGSVEEGSAALLRRVGGPERLGLYVVNALLACLNLLLLHHLLRRQRPESSTFPFLLLYASALSTWVFASVPESWTLSTALVLVFFCVLRSERAGGAAGVLVGVMMLNNVMLGCLTLLAALRDHRAARTSAWLLPLRLGGHITLAVGTWAILSSILAVYDPMLRPDHFLEYTLWFREFTGRDLPPWDPYVWKSALSNLFVTSVASNQADPAIPQEAMLLTLQGSILGAATTIAYLGLLAVAAVRVGRAFVEEVGKGEGILVTAAANRFLPAVFCLMMGAITGLLYHSSGFLYSTLVVPLLVLTIAGVMDLGRRRDMLLFSAVLVLILINNSQQVMRFREALAGMS